MKKILLFALSFGLLFSLVACGQETESTPKAQETETSASVRAEHDDLTPILKEIEALEIGTAGSNLKAVAPAADLARWSAETAMTQEEIKETVAAFLKAAADQEEFRAQIETVVGTVHSIRAEGGEDLLFDVGVELPDEVLLSIRDENLLAIKHALITE